MIVRKIFYKEYDIGKLEDNIKEYLSLEKSQLVRDVNSWAEASGAEIININEESYIGEFTEQLPFFFRIVVYAKI